MKRPKAYTIGRSDKADFPDIGIEKIDVKIDSGAYTSAIHCSRIEKTNEGVLKVVFLDKSDPNFSGKVYRFKKFSKTIVKSSNAIAEKRFVITTKIRFHKKIYDISLSLTHRREMRFNVLIGRRFLSQNRFVVDPRLKDRMHKKSVKE